MARTIVDIGDDATLSAMHSSRPLRITAASALTIPLEVDSDFALLDEIPIFADTAGAVTLVAAEGVTLKAKGTTITQNGYVTLCKIAANTWIAYGDLS